MRLAPTTALGPKLLDFNASDDVMEMVPGTVIHAAGTDYSTTSNVPNWGLCELIYVRSTSSSTFIPGRLLHLDKDFTILDMPNTANTGRPVYVSLTNWAAGNTTTQYGWVLRSGTCPVSFSTAATAGAMYFNAAGQAQPGAAAGKQLLNATCLIAATGSFTRTVQTVNGSSRVKLSGVAGVFTGQAVSGTGIPASSVVSSVDASGREIVIGSAIGTPVAATATGSVTATFTHTGYGICHVDRACVQGQIT